MKTLLALVLTSLQLAAAPILAANPRDIVRRDDENRPDKQQTVRIYGEEITIGGEIESSWDFRADRELEHGEEDEEYDASHKLEIEAVYPVNPNLILFGEVKVGWDWLFRAPDGGSDHHRLFVERGETWLYWADILDTPLALQVGRQNFKDKREFWWDADLDAVRLHWNSEPFRIELAVAQELARVRGHDDRIDPAEDKVRRILGYARWDWAERKTTELFFLRHDDRSSEGALGSLVSTSREDEIDAKLTWLGLRNRGRLKRDPFGRFYYWLDLAGVWGDEKRFDYDRIAGSPGVRILDEVDEIDVRGFAVDGGVTLDPGSKGGVTWTLGWAYGSGDDGEGTDRSFRQTGLQDNNGRFRGVDRFRLYGELLRPELSNLHVGTVGVGYPLFRDSSVELLYHYYRQDHAADFLRDSELRISPNGRGKTIGQGWDLVIGLEEWTHWEIEIVGSLFRAGTAFGHRSGRWSQFLGLEFDYNF